LFAGVKVSRTARLINPDYRSQMRQKAGFLWPAIEARRKRETENALVGGLRPVLCGHRCFGLSAYFQMNKR
jgi:hypothetical protein